MEEQQAPESPPQVKDADAELRHTVFTHLHHVIGYSDILLKIAQKRELGDITERLQKIRQAGGDLLTLLQDVFAHGRSRPTLNIPRQESGPQTSPVGHAHVLVVDDQPNNRDIACSILKAAGYQVSEADNGAVALERVAELKPDLVLMDIMMPVMDGIEACGRLKGDPESRLTPVIIMTALGQVDDRIRGIQAGADDYLSKPVHPQELLARIQTSLRLKQTVDAKVGRLQGQQDYLMRFVPQSVKRLVAENPDYMTVEKVDQDLSALFVDVTSYAKLSQNLRQTADFLIEKYFSRYLDVIHDHRGDVTETSGDGLMVVFPGPDPQGHARAAVRAARDILHRTKLLNTQLDGIFDPISVHIGINSGIALLGPVKYEGTSGTRWVYTALGPVVNLAARIAGQAESGTILVGPDTASRLGDEFTLIEVGKRTLKNVRGDVLLHQVVET